MSSNLRRAFGNSCIGLLIPYTVFAALNLPLDRNMLGLISWLMLGISGLFFGWVVLMPIFKFPGIKLEARRLVADVVISMCIMVPAFALVYQYHGLVPPSFQTTALTNSDFFYFSAVTFSTLGFGDFTPQPASRPYAAFQAIFGNIHLGILVGAFFAVVSKARSHRYNTDNQSNEITNKQTSWENGHD